jgi:hypothetical protein
MKKLKFFGLCLFFSLSNTLFSAPPPPPTGGPGCWPPPCVPVDNGLIFLMVAGLLFGAKKFYDLRRSSRQSA